MSTPIQISTNDVPTSFCHQNWQNTWQTLVGLLQASFAGDLQTVNFGNTTPAAIDRDKPWFRVNADGTPDGWYSFANGSWLKRYAGPDAGAIMLWDGLEASIVTLDGGEAGTITTTQGAFWERVTSMDAKFPLGVGTLASGATVAVGGTGGSEEVELESVNMPRHDHGIPNHKLVHQTPTSGTLNQVSGNDLSVSTFRADGGNADGSTEPHNNMPPYRGVFFIRRTARLYHRAP